MLNSWVVWAVASAAIAVQAEYHKIPQAPPAQPNATAATPARPAAPGVAAILVTGRTLKGLPNTAVRYYDVKGRSPNAIKKSIARQRPKDSTGEVITASTAWDIGATFRKRTENGQCRIAAVQATFTATADLPRLTSEKSLAPEVVASWRAYVAGLEAAAAAKLWFIYDNIGNVEKAILASSCDGALAAGAAAVEQLKRREAGLQAAAATRPGN